MKPVFPVVLTVLAFASNARAQTDTPQSLVHHGIELRQQGHDDESIDVFRRAWEMGHQLIALAQWGLAEQAVGRWVPAEAHVREALTHQDDAWIARHLAAVQAAYAVIQQHVGTLELHGGVAGAHVSVNGTDDGTLPLAEPLHVEAGTAVLEVTADGFERVRRDVQVLAGQLNREEISMVSGAPMAASQSPAGETRGVNVARVMLGAGAAGLGVGGVAWIASFALVNAAGCSTSFVTATCTNGSSGGADVVSGIAVGAGVIGVVALGVGIAMLLTGRNEQRRAAWMLVPTQGGAVASWNARF